MTERFKTKPRDHQLEGIRLVDGRTAFAYLAEMGTGKSWMLINDVASLWGEGRVNGLLIFAVNGGQWTWTLNELPAHMPDWVRWRSAAWSAHQTKKTAHALNSILTGDDSTELRVLVMNHEALQTKRGLEFAQRFATSVIKLMIAVDESSGFKNPQAVRTKALFSLKPFSTYRRILDGFAINNGPFDAFAQFSFLDETILRTTSYFAFKAEYAEMLSPTNALVQSVKRRSGSRGTPQIVARAPDGKPRYKNLDKLNALIAPHSFRVLKADCLDLPEKVYTQTYFELEPQQRKVYDLMEDQARMIIENGEETPVARLAALMKLSQINSGFIISPITREPMPIEGENPKLSLLESRLETLIEGGQRIIVWARFREELKQIAALAARRGWSIVQYHGDTPRDERIEGITKFQAGEANIFLAQQQVGATTITLTAATHVIYYSNTFSARDRWQSEDRAHRIGQRNVVTYEDLIALKTIDAKIVSVLRSKRDCAELVMGDRKDLFSGAIPASLEAPTQGE